MRQAMQEYIYLIRTRREAQFAGQRLERSFLPQVLQDLCFFVLRNDRVYVAIGMSERAAPALHQWAHRILSECGERCDPALTIAQLKSGELEVSEVYLKRGGGFL